MAENLSGLARTVRGYATMLSQNVALWHERDISHSSVERIALPDMFVTAHFMTDRLASLVSKMQINPAVMLANLNKTGGLWCSQTVLTHLVDAGMNRTAAYELIQTIALPIGAKSALGLVSKDEFLNALLQDKRVTPLLGPETLRTLFLPERFLASVPVVFKRVYGIAPEDFARRHSESIVARTPALQCIYKIEVELLPDVLDTEAKAIENDMRHAGVSLLGLRQSRSFILRCENRMNIGEIYKYASDTLQNAVIETMRVEVVQ